MFYFPLYLAAIIPCENLALSYETPPVSYETRRVSYEMFSVSYEMFVVSYEIALVSYEMFAVSYEMDERSYKSGELLDRITAFLYVIRVRFQNTRPEVAFHGLLLEEEAALRRDSKRRLSF